MNEGLMVFLNLDEREHVENETLIRRIDELLLNCGVEYTGFRNLYKPVESKDRDRAVFAACRALDDADWLRDKLNSIPIMNRTDACPMDQIRLDNMKDPSAAKMEYYERFYRETRTLAHGIIVDEDGQLRDGYTSYIIAKKYGVHPNICEAFAGQPLKKIVMGRHVMRDKNTWKIKSGKGYAWNYTLKDPVIPGDILQVKTQKGSAFMCVSRIDYVTGEEFCQKHRSVTRHMKESMQSQD